MEEHEIHDRIEELNYRLRQEDNSLKELFDQMSAKKGEKNEAIRLRDESNKKVKQIIDKAKLHQAARDRLHGEAKKLRNKMRDYSREVSSRARKISQEKEIRNQFQREARGSPESLSKQFGGAIQTLITMELSLKNEIIMVEMIMELQKRYEAKKAADEVHHDIQETYKDLKETEAEAKSEFSTLSEVLARAQEEHQTAIDLFSEKDRERDSGQEHHQRFLEISKEMKEIGKAIDRSKDHKNEVRDEINKLRDELKKIDRGRKEAEKAKKLGKAKEKVQKGGKMDLEELRLLVESGQLK